MEWYIYNIACNLSCQLFPLSAIFRACETSAQKQRAPEDPSTGLNFPLKPGHLLSQNTLLGPNATWGKESIEDELQRRREAGG